MHNPRGWMSTAAMCMLLIGCADNPHVGVATVPATQDNVRKGCTQEVKRCPDGTWVGRAGPACEFKCP